MYIFVIVINLFAFVSQYVFLRRFPFQRGRRRRHGNASVRNRVLGRERDHPDRAHVQPRQSRAPDMRVVRPVSSGSAFERAHLGGAELAPEEDVPRTAARLDDHRQASRAARRGKVLKVCSRLEMFLFFAYAIQSFVLTVSF